MVRNDGDSSASGDQEIYAGAGQTWHGGRAQAKRLWGGEDVRAGRKYTPKHPPSSASAPEHHLDQSHHVCLNTREAAFTHIFSKKSSDLRSAGREHMWAFWVKNRRSC